uniref:WD repeat domain phosphoinositide-interacting protein 2 n=1 Tax=Syphacia muris TaxID=451379 RepID=A0A0N5AIJ4_9BILA
MANTVLSISFNQDFACFACGTKDGFSVYNTDPLKKCYQEKLNGSVGAVEMLFRCNYVALVSGGSNPAFASNVVVVWDVSNHKEVMRLEMNENVIGTRLRRDYIVVVLCNSLEVYSFTSDPKKVIIYESYKNCQGICCLCQSSDNPLLAFPSPGSPGSVAVIKLGDTDDNKLRTISAHKRPIVAIALNFTGSHMATASEKGTIIRIFDTNTLLLMKELRRGTNPANIYCLNFSPDSTLLCASSNHSTVHLFSLKRNKQKSPLHKLSLPGESSFSKFQLPFSLKKNDLCLCSFGAQMNSVIGKYYAPVSSDGNYCKFNYEPLKGSCVRQTCSLYLEVKD